MNKYSFLLTAALNLISATFTIAFAQNSDFNITLPTKWIHNYSSLNFNTNSNQIIYISSDKDELYFHDLNDGELKQSYKSKINIYSNSKVIFNEKGTLIALMSEQSLEIIDATTGKNLNSWNYIVKSAMNSMSFINNDTEILVISNNGDLNIINIQNGKTQLIHSLGFSVESSSISNDGQKVCVNGKLYNCKQNKIEKSDWLLPNIDTGGRIIGCKFSDNGKLLITETYKMIILWDLIGKRKIGEWENSSYKSSNHLKVFIEEDSKIVLADGRFIRTFSTNDFKEINRVLFDEFISDFKIIIPNQITIDEYYNQAYNNYIFGECIEASIYSCANENVADNFFKNFSKGKLSIQEIISQINSKEKSRVINPIMNGEKLKFEKNNDSSIYHQDNLLSFRIDGQMMPSDIPFIVGMHKLKNSNGEVFLVHVQNIIKEGELKSRKQVQAQLEIDYQNYSKVEGLQLKKEKSKIIIAKISGSIQSFNLSILNENNNKTNQSITDFGYSNFVLNYLGNPNYGKIDSKEVLNTKFKRIHDFLILNYYYQLEYSNMSLSTHEDIIISDFKKMLQLILADTNIIKTQSDRTSLKDILCSLNDESTSYCASKTIEDLFIRWSRVNLSSASTIYDSGPNLNIWIYESTPPQEITSINGNNSNLSNVNNTSSSKSTNSNINGNINSNSNEVTSISCSLKFTRPQMTFILVDNRERCCCCGAAMARYSSNIENAKQHETISYLVNQIVYHAIDNNLSTEHLASDAQRLGVFVAENYSVLAGLAVPQSTIMIYQAAKMGLFPRMTKKVKINKYQLVSKYCGQRCENDYRCNCGD